VARLARASPGPSGPMPPCFSLSTHRGQDRRRYRGFSCDARPGVARGRGRPPHNLPLALFARDSQNCGVVFRPCRASAGARRLTGSKNRVEVPRMRYPTFAAVLTSSPISGTRILTISPGVSAASCGTMIPVPVSSTVPSGHAVGEGERLDQRIQPPVQRGSGNGALENDLPAALDGAGDFERIGIGQRIGGEDDGAEGAATVVDLGLRQVEGILALDVPGGNVVGERVARDASAAAQHHGQLRFGRGEARIGANADGLPEGTQTRAVPLKKISGRGSRYT
jgi:hypothetical protein